MAMVSRIFYFWELFLISNPLNLIIGTCEPEEFAKALEKIGVFVPSKKDLQNLF